MKRLLTSLIVTISTTLYAQAQTPFDMTPERPVAPETSTPAPQPAPEPPPAPQMNAQPQQPVAPVQNLSGRRYLVPVSSLVLAGEIAERSWSVYLTPEQAAATATLNLGYQSAIVVAPESSRLRLLVNNGSVIDEAIQSSDGVSERSAQIPAGILRAGYNLVTLQATQRHRTDCGVPSTYELWTEIDQSTTYLSFADAAATTLTRVDDIRAIGVDDTGQTSFNMVVPAADQSTSTGSLIRLAEGLAIMGGMPNQTFSISKTAVAPANPGHINVVVGTANEVRTVMGAVPSGADVAPIATFVNDPQLGPSTLVITGPSWQSLATAIETISAPTDRPASVSRSALVTQTWRSPDAPLLLSAARLRFSEMGTKTQQFSGRRFRTDFTVGVPSDFYAGSYGEATILLDAAYSGEVLPGSHIDVYVNDNIAATLPITTRGGEILRHLPISVTMRHFRPGANTIAIEAVLLTSADEVCAPGASTSETNRFVLFDTSEFVMPNYARIGQRPNLAAVAGTAFPYGRTADPIPLIIDHTQLETLSAATTLLARMSVAAGRSIPVDLTVTAENVGDRNAIFVSPITQLPPAIMSQAGIAEASRVSWGTALPGTGESGPSTDATFAEWRERLSGRGWRGQISALEDWLNRNFDISLESLRLRPRADIDYVPSSDATLLIAQSGSPNGEGTWTVVTAPNPQNLGDSMRSLVSQNNWAQVGGHITIFNATTNQVDTVPVNNFTFVETQQGSLTNYRLIVSNWLSANVLSYSGLLAIFCVVLGLVTAAMLATMGRRR